MSEVKAISLDSIQSKVTVFFLILLAAHVPIIFLSSYIVKDGSALEAAISLVIAALCFLSYKIYGNEFITKLTISLSLVIVVSLFVFVFKGHNWQIDMHMYFFAMLAMVAAYVDWRIILSSATLIALHHLVLNFLMPLAVFPDGGDFFRVVLHAVIVVLETGTLIWLSKLVVDSITSNEIIAEQERKKVMEMVKEREAQREIKEKEDKQVLNRFAKEFRQKVDSSLKRVIKDSEQLHKFSENLVVKINESTDKASESLEFSNRTSGNVMGVAEAVEELSVSNSNITQKTKDSISTVKSSVEYVSTAESKSVKLYDSVSKIEDVVSFVKRIAEQINLLALNATIEAARAGEYGKGFAVVAQEVKSLASQTSDALKNITNSVADIQVVSNEVKEMLDSMSSFMQKIEENSLDVTEAVVEQSQANQEISKNMSETVENVNKSDENINSIKGSLSKVQADVKELVSSSQGMINQANVLNGEVDSFLQEVVQE